MKRSTLRGRALGALISVLTALYNPKSVPFSVITTGGVSLAYRWERARCSATLSASSKDAAKENSESAAESVPMMVGAQEAKWILAH